MSSHNLVPVYYDKTTGDYYVSNAPQAGGGSYGYVHEQPVESSVWFIEHNGGTTNFICQIYDLNGNLIIPSEQLIIDSDNIEVYFGSPQAGTARVMFFQTI